MNHSRTRIVLFALLMLTAVGGGCVRRTLTIHTDPQGATVVLNDENVGLSPVSRDFTWYGDYDVVIRKPGYETLLTHVVVNPPWYEMAPLDLFFDVFWPGQLHDRHEHSFSLTPRVPPEPDDVIQRALDLRTRALSDGE